MKKNIEELASQILLHRKLYYTGFARISDEAFDALEEQLRALAPFHPVLNRVGYESEAGKGKVQHVRPMLSLDKTYDIDTLYKFLQEHPTLVSDKVDGMALSLEYDASGRFVRASTRGNGRVGENVTEHVMHITAIPKILDVNAWKAQTLFDPPLEGVEIRGEVFFPLSHFAPFSHRFDSWRNAVPGTMGRKEVHEAVDVLNAFSFWAYDILLYKSTDTPMSPKENPIYTANPSPSFLSKLETLEKQGFLTGLQSGYALATPPLQKEDLPAFVESWFLKARDWQIDGMVFRYLDDQLWENLGATTHHPRGSLAFKQTGEVATTRIVSIEDRVTRTGKISFRAHLEPVFLAGAMISKATLHNAEFIEKGGYAPGAEVEIKRSGEVIPAIMGLVSEAPQPYALPSLCPCGFELVREGPDLRCVEPSGCVRRDKSSLEHFVSVIDAVGVSVKLVSLLVDEGLLREPADFYKIKKEDLLKLEGFAEKSSENFIKSFEERRQLPLSLLLNAMGISHGGMVRAREVAALGKTIEGVAALKVEDLVALDRWNTKTATDFIAGFSAKWPLIHNLLQVVTALPDDQLDQKSQSQGHPCYGKIFCITGALSRPRDEFKARIEAAGGKVSASVSKNTHFLICNAPSETSKAKDAAKHGIPILDESQLEALLNGDSPLVSPTPPSEPI